MHVSNEAQGRDRTTSVTIRDVADRAGVSTATVSRVLAGVGGARPATSAAVHQAVSELGYRPSAVARSLRMRRTQTLGLIVTDIQNPFFPELVQAADVAARARRLLDHPGQRRVRRASRHALPRPHGRPPRGWPAHRLQPAVRRHLGLGRGLPGAR